LLPQEQPQLQHRVVLVDLAVVAVAVQMQQEQLLVAQVAQESFTFSTRSKL